MSGENRPYGETNPINFSCGGLRLVETIIQLAGPNPTRQSRVLARLKLSSWDKSASQECLLVATYSLWSLQIR